MNNELYTSIYFMFACNLRSISPHLLLTENFKEFKQTYKNNKLDVETFAHLHLGVLGMYAFVEYNNPSRLEMLKQEYGLTDEEAKGVVEQIDKIFKEYEIENNESN